MPNWCGTAYQIKGDPKELKILHDEFLNAQKGATIKTGFGEQWLGHLLTHLGMTEEDITNGHISCRGSVTYIGLNENELLIDTDTAWGPMPQPIAMMCEKYAPNAQIIFTAVEPGCGIYITNDASIAGTYLVDVWENSNLPENLTMLDYDYLKPEDLKTELETALGVQDGIGKLIQKAESLWWEDMSINRVEWCDIEEL